MYLRKTIFILFCSLVTISLFSQSEEIIVFYNTENDTAPERSTHVTQCNQGYIWTINGRTLHRFDGKNFWEYPDLPTILLNGYNTGLYTYQDSLLFVHSGNYIFLFNPTLNKWESLRLKKDGIYFEVNFIQRLGSDDMIIHSYDQDNNSRKVEFWRFKNKKLVPIELPIKLYEKSGFDDLSRPFDFGPLPWLTIDNHKNKYLLDKEILHVWDSTNYLIAEIQLDSFFPKKESTREFKTQFDLDNQLNVLIGGKIYILNNSKDAFLLHPFYELLKSSYSTQFIITNDFLYDKNGNVWIQCEDNSTKEKLLFYYEPFKNKFQNFSKRFDFENNHIYKIYEDRSGVTWFSTEEGLGKIQPFSNSVKRFNFEDAAHDPYGDTVSAINVYPYFSNFIENKKGEIYAVFEDNIIRFDPRKNDDTYEIFPEIDRGVDIHLTERGLLLSSGRLLDQKTGKVQEIANAHPKIDSTINAFSHFTFSRWDKNLYTKILKGETYSKSNYIFKKYYSDLIIEDKDQTIWRANDSILYYLDQSQTDWIWREEISPLIKSTKEEQKFKQKLKDNFNIKFEELLNVFSLGETSNKLWLGYRSGKLISYTPQTKELEQFELIENEEYLSINGIHEDSKGMLWLATSDGLFHFNPKTKERKKYGIKDGLFDNSSIGLNGNSILGLVAEGDSSLRVSTVKVISRFHIPSGKFLNLLPKDGEVDFGGNNFQINSAFKSSKGEFFFGMQSSVISFPSNIRYKKYKNISEAPPFVLSSFEYFDESRDTSIKRYNITNYSEIELEYGSKSLTFEFALADFQTPEELQYRYTLDGYDDTWSILSKFNIARYVSLPTGSYTFLVEAKDANGRWHADQLAVKLKIRPPWWKTKLAYSIYFLILLGIAFGIFSVIKRRLLLQAQLKREKQEALRLKELDNFKSKLYTNLTHEFRTPLTVILGMVQQIRNEPKKYLDEGTQMIERNGRNLLRLVNQLLDLSKLEDRSFQLKLQQSDIIPYLKYITESFHTYVNSKNLSLQFFTPVETLIMDHDPEQIKQVLTNLISNAVKFTPSGGEVVVRVTKENEQLKIEVKDTGIGISKKEIPHIFDRFYQVDGSMTREGEGTGIGLAHTQELVKLMGGKVSVNSVLEKGSTFIIYLPIRNQAPIEETILKKEVINKINLDLKKLSKLDAPISEKNNIPQLLIIEDNRDVVIYLKSCLENSYQIDVAYNGQVGIEKALEHIPDLIISDVMMPQKNGFEVCDFLKNDERTSHIPIILLTAKADTDSKIVGLQRGADAYLSKPFDKEELIIRLKKLVERQQKMRTYFSSRTIGEIQPIETKGIEEAIQIEDAFIQKVKKIIEENYSDENFALPQLCQKIRMSRSQLFRKMKALVDTSPSDFIRTYRLEKAKHFLETTDMNVSEVSWEVGFKDVSHFSKVFQNAFGFLPSDVNNK